MRDLAKDWNEKKHRNVELFIALCTLSIEKQHAASEGFTSLELVEAVNEQRNREWSNLKDPDQCSKDVNTQWKKLVELWATKKEGISEALNNKNITALPQLEKIKGGG